jgi:hypothetical protein
VKRALNGGRRLGVRPVKLPDPLARMQRLMPCDTTSQGARRRRSARQHPAPSPALAQHLLFQLHADDLAVCTLPPSEILYSA